MPVGVMSDVTFWNLKKEIVLHAVGNCSMDFLESVNKPGLQKDLNSLKLNSGSQKASTIQQWCYHYHSPWYNAAGSCSVTTEGDLLWQLSVLLPSFV